MGSARPGLTTSARQIDPLSWLTVPLIPIAFAALGLIYGVVISVITWADSPMPWLQLVATVLCASSAVAVYAATRPLRGELGWVGASLTLIPAILGVVVSALGLVDTDLAPQTWWAPGALALMIASLGPYLPVRQILAVGGGTTLVTVLISLAIVHPGGNRWGPVGTAVIIAYPPLLAIIATAAFSYWVVSTMVRMLASPSRILTAGQTVRDEVAQRVEAVTVARLTARATPFLESIAEAGRITPADRALAGQLARHLRDELVTETNLTWLDSIAAESRLVVVDPERRARRMNNAQRTAMRAMLRAILDTPGIDSGSLMVELREGPDAGTAVAVSLDMALPEGRRTMHLAPYYLALRTAVRDLTIDHDTLLKLSFSVPAERD